jgi:hypothetical protein
VPPGAHECLVQTLKVLGNGQAVHDDEPLNGGRVIHGRSEGHQRGCHAVPGRVGAGMTVQQHHRLPLTAVPHAERHLTEVDTVHLESIEHEPRLPTRSNANRERKSHPAYPPKPRRTSLQLTGKLTLNRNPDTRWWRVPKTGRPGAGAAAVGMADLVACIGDGGGDQGLLDLSDGNWMSGKVRCWHRSQAGGRRSAAGGGPGRVGAGDGPPGAGAAFKGDGQPVGIFVVAPGGGGDAGHVRRVRDEQLLEFCWCHRRSARRVRVPRASGGAP